MGFCGYEIRMGKWLHGSWIIALCTIYFVFQYSYYNSKYKTLFESANNIQNLSAQKDVDGSPQIRIISRPRVTFLGKENAGGVSTPTTYRSQLKVNSTLKLDLPNTLNKILSPSLQIELKNDLPKFQESQVIIVTSWRSGSSFLEAIFKAHLGTFDIHEPLHQYGLVRFKETDHNYQEAVAEVHNFLKCKIQNQEYLNYSRKTQFMLQINSQYKKTCARGFNYDICYNKSFFELACKLFPRIVMKIVRAGLDIVKAALADPSLNSKAILLVRDPRATFNSRISSVKWCKDLCMDVSAHCDSMEKDLETFFKFESQFPGRVKLVRYEDLALSPLESARQLMEKLRLDFTPIMESFVNSHSTRDGSLNPVSTTRISRKRVLQWPQSLTFWKVREIQEKCQTVMNRLGYVPVNSLTGLTIKDVLKPLS